MTTLFSRFTKYIGIFFIVFISFYMLFLSLASREILVNPPFGEIKSGKDIINYVNYYVTSIASTFENKFYDFRMMNNSERKSYNPKIVLAQISDKTLNKIGSWPIPRTKYAEFLDKLKMYGAKTVGFDIFFPEASLSCNVGSDHPDEIFANSIRNFQEVIDLENTSRAVLAYSLSPLGLEGTFKEMPDALYNFILDSQNAEGTNFFKFAIDKQTFSIDKIINSEIDLGFISMEADNDGIFRHYRLVTNIDDLYVPSLALRLFQNYSGESGKLEIHRTGNGIFKFNDFEIPLNKLGETKIRWFGEFNNFQLVNFEDVLESDGKNKLLKQKLQNSIVLIGSTATGAHDLRHSPINPVMPGVYAHINMIHMMMEKYFYKDIEESWKISLIIMIAGLTLILGLQFFGSATVDLFAFLFAVSVSYWFDFDRFLPQGYELKLFICYFSFILTYIWITFLNFAQANKEKKQIKGTFARYVAPSIVNDMLDNPEKLKVGGERKDITCLFSDVRDFTSISEKLSATELARALNIYMGAMTDIVFENKGTLDKYIGDAIVAFWGAPLELENHPHEALTAAVKMLEKLPEINDGFLKEGLPEFKIGLGLNSGECSVGNMGSDQIFSYTALGDHMNLGARLESLCKHYGAQILISEYTFNRIDKNIFGHRQIDNVKVKGKTQPVGVYEILYSHHRLQLDQTSLDNFKTAYSFYLEKNFKESSRLFKLVLDKYSDDPPTQRLLANSDKYIINPPTEDEDHTITTMTTK